MHAALEPYGLGLADALFVHLYLARMEDFSATNKAYGRHFPAVNPPARACVETQLPLGVDLMVDVIVARGGCLSNAHICYFLRLSLFCCRIIKWIA